MAKPEYYYGVHSVESLLELEPERANPVYFKRTDDQRLQKILQLAEPFELVYKKQAVIVLKSLQVYRFIKAWLQQYVRIRL